MPNEEKPTVPQVILDLVERFERNREAYKSGNYNETQVRREFLDPVFKALGWDIDNEQGYAEDYKDVIHEDAIKTADGTKAPDYGFRIGGTRKFFLEDKRPSVDIKNDVSPALQLRRYGWTTKLPLSVLSDFEEFAVYDCRFKPDKNDSAAVGRILYIPFTEYARRWHEIAAIFSKDAVLKGSFDKFAESSKAKRGTADVDDAFLDTIETWRKELAQNLALRNKQLSQRELNFAVQRIIDRIIFLRICEGRGIEDYGRLRALADGDKIYPRLGKLFEQADDRYNSGLFHFRAEKGRHEAPDELTLKLDLDDKLLRDILKNLYYPDSPYVFSALSADVLGQVYEQFLGKVIRLTPAHRAEVDDKPEVKKAGGVYYTPTYIVEYIVQNTMGKLLNDCSSRGNEAQTSGMNEPSHVGCYTNREAARILARVAKLKILDPACGSGSFLLGAYEHLLKWHRDFYTQNDPVKWAKGSQPVLVQTASGGWKLTVTERKRILLDNLYGVDIDTQAVETTKLSLLLKVLEGETSQTIQPELLHTRALPDLGDNIKCGNSLIGPDFYEQQQMTLLDEEERYRVNVFDWHTQFPQVFSRPATELHDAAPGQLDYTVPGVPLHGSFSYKKTKKSVPMPEPEYDGGFDAVIGNPPYIRIQTMQESSPQSVEYLKDHYAAASKGNYDIYVVFVEKALSLLNPQGALGYILPHKFFNAQYGSSLRQSLGKGRNLSQVVHFGAEQVFVGATTYTCLLFLTKKPQSKFRFVKVAKLADWRVKGEAVEGLLPAAGVTGDEWNFNVGSGSAMFECLRGLPLKLGDVADIFVGLQTSADDVFIMDLVDEKPKTLRLKSQALDKEFVLERDLFFPLVSGTDVSGYRTLPERQYILFPYVVNDERAELMPFTEISKRFPKTAAYLLENQKRLEDRERGKFKDADWHRFGRSQNLGIQQREKICVPRLVDQLCAAYDASGVHFLDNVDVGGVTFKPDYEKHDLRYLLALLNSRLLRWYFPFVSAPFRGGWMSANKQFLSQLPFREIVFSDKADKGRHDQMVSLVEQMLALHQSLAAAKTPPEQTALERQIAATDQQIDRLVYQLYGLTDDEIKLVEGTGK